MSARSGVLYTGRDSSVIGIPSSASYPISPNASRIFFDQRVHVHQCFGVGLSLELFAKDDIVGIRHIVNRILPLRYGVCLLLCHGLMDLRKARALLSRMRKSIVPSHNSALCLCVHVPLQNTHSFRQLLLRGPFLHGRRSMFQTR